jgi:hypothetical protein
LFIVWYMFWGGELNEFLKGGGGRDNYNILKYIISSPDTQARQGKARHRQDRVRVEEYIYRNYIAILVNADAHTHDRVPFW